MSDVAITGITFIFPLIVARLVFEPDHHAFEAEGRLWITLREQLWLVLGGHTVEGWGWRSEEEN